MAENKAVGYESMLDDMNAIITEAKPGMRGYVKLDLDRLSSLIFEMRTTIPDQILQARRIATERVSIIQNAQTKANTMVQTAQENADAIVADAQKQAEEMIEQDQIRLVGSDSPEGGFTISHDLCIKAFLCEIQTDQLCNIAVIIYDENFIF